MTSRKQANKHNVLNWNTDREESDDRFVDCERLWDELFSPSSPSACCGALPNSVMNSILPSSRGERDRRDPFSLSEDVDSSSELKENKRRDKLFSDTVKSQPLLSKHPGVRWYFAISAPAYISAPVCISAFREKNISVLFCFAYSFLFKHCIFSLLYTLFSIYDFEPEIIPIDDS